MSALDAERYPRRPDGSRLSGAEQLGRILNPAAPDWAGVDPRFAAQTATNWRMGARLYAEIRARELQGRFPADAMEALRRTHLATAMRNRLLRRRAVEVLRALAAAGVQPMVLKGGVALLTATEPAGCTRFMEDLDLLVAPAEYQKAERALMGLGFVHGSDHLIEEHLHGPKLQEATSGVEIELHIRPTTFGNEEFLAGFLASAQPVPIEDGLVARIPGNGHQILHNMIHAQEGHANFVRKTADLRQLFEFVEKCRHAGAALDWDWLIGSATALGLRRHMLSWLYAAHRIFGLALPPGQRFGWIERNQSRAIRNGELRGTVFNALDDFAGYHLYAARGVLTARELREFYGYWSRRMLPRRQADGPLLGPTFEGLHGPAKTYDVRRPKLY